jgi:hypothetical protein
MKTVVEYLDDLKEKTGSDYMTAKKTGLSKVSISAIRKRGQMSDETAIKMADLLGVDRSEVLIAAAIARSEGEVKKSWEVISKMSGIAATITIGSALTFGMIATEEGSNQPQPMANSAYYVKSLVLFLMLITGKIFALALVFNQWSQTYGSKKENQLLSYT